MKNVKSKWLVKLGMGLTLASVLSLSACSEDEVEKVIKEKVEEVEKEIPTVDTVSKEKESRPDKTWEQAEKELKEKNDNDASLTTPVIEEEEKTNTPVVEEKEPTYEKSKNVTKTSGTTEKIPVEYVRIVDGDTARFIYNGEERPVRYLLMDTPESKKRGVPVQPFSLEASELNKKLLENANQVYLEFDIGQRTDHYNRLLAYVWADDILVNEEIIKQGLAIKAYVKAPNTRYLDNIEKAQEYAKANKLNVWSIDNYVMGEGFNIVEEGSTTVAPTTNTSTPKQQTPPKQAASTAIEGATEKFKNCTELRKVYPNGVDSNHPAYSTKMDRNNDGRACER